MKSIPAAYSGIEHSCIAHSPKLLQGGSDNFISPHYRRPPIGWFLTGLLQENKKKTKSLWKNRDFS